MRHDDEDVHDHHPPREQRMRKKDKKPAPPMPTSVVLEAAQAVVTALRCELLEHSLYPGGRARFVVDRDPGVVDADLLVDLVRGLHQELTTRGLDPTDYEIEFESPGNHRLLSTPRHVERFVGQRVRALLTVPIEGRSSIVGKLLGIDAGRPVVLSDDGHRVALEPHEIRELRLHA